jgi:hypothetical protein
VRFVRTSFLDVREGNSPVSGSDGGGRHGQQYVVLRLGARLERGADESPCDKSKAQCLDRRRTLGNDNYTEKGGTVQQLAETQEHKCE